MPAHTLVLNPSPPPPGGPTWPVLAHMAGSGLHKAPECILLRRAAVNHGGPAAATCARLEGPARLAAVMALLLIRQRELLSPLPASGLGG